MNQSKFLWWPK